MIPFEQRPEYQFGLVGEKDIAKLLQERGAYVIALSIFETAETYSLTKGRLSDLLCGAVDVIGLSGWSVPA